MGAVALAPFREPIHLLAFTTTLIIGGAVGTFALARTRFEPTLSGLYYTPRGPIAVAPAVLFVARLVYRFMASTRAMGEYGCQRIAKAFGVHCTAAGRGLRAAMAGTSGARVMLDEWDLPWKLL